MSRLRRVINCRLPGKALGLIVMLLLCLASSLSHAQSPSPQPDESERRSSAVAQVVLGILSYARWPADPAEIRLCVVAATEYADNLLQGPAQASGRSVHTSRLSVDGPLLSTQCDAIYTGVMTDEETQRLFSRLAGHPILSIAEHDDQCAVGSMFCLNVADTQISFQINLDSVARSGVRVHPRVLQLARKAPRP